MTTTIQFDPAALEAAAKKAKEWAFGYGLDRFDYEKYDLPEPYESFAIAIVTAYLAAIEPQVREAVVEVIECASDVEKSRHWGEKRHGRDVVDLDNARTALFALLGMTATTSETSAN